jgi:hypothetical protein
MCLLLLENFIVSDSNIPVIYFYFYRNTFNIIESILWHYFNIMLNWWTNSLIFLMEQVHEGYMKKISNMWASFDEACSVINCVTSFVLEYLDYDFLGRQSVSSGFCGVRLFYFFASLKIITSNAHSHLLSIEVLHIAKYFSYKLHKIWPKSCTGKLYKIQSCMVI